MQGEQQSATTLDQKINLIQNLALFPALTVMVFVRKKLGYRFIDLMKIQLMVILLWALSAFSGVAGGALSGAIIFLFALAVLIAAYIERRIRWNEIKRGVSWHSYSRGISWFGGFIGETNAKRFADPAAVLIVGIVFFFLFRYLGLYFILCAVCLFLFETIDYQRSIDEMLDVLDSLVKSEVISENTEYFQSGGATKERPIEQTAGIPTGTDPDLAAAIERRRARSGGSQPVQAVTQQTEREPEPSGQLRRQRLQVQTEPEPPAQQVTSGRLRRERLQEPEAAPVIPVIQSPNDPAFLVLPSGAEFKTPDGKVRRKN